MNIVKQKSEFLNKALQNIPSEDSGDLPHEATPLLHGNSIDSSIDYEQQLKLSINNASEKIKPQKENSYLASFTSFRQLDKNVGFLQGFSLIVGLLVGSGIFISPALVIKQTNDVGIALLLWFVCGMIALGGSLCYCELGCAIKRAGGNYAYIQEAYGNLPAFLCSWTVAFIVDPAGLAAITLILGTYMVKPFEEYIGQNPLYAKAVAASTILLVAFINCWGTKAATKAQTLFTFAQIFAVVFVAVIGAWMLIKGHTKNLTHDLFSSRMLSNFSMKDTAMLGSALYNGLWAYDGWALVTNVTEEMKNLERNLFLSIITAIPFVICCYFFVNISFISVLSVQQISNSPAIAVTFVQETLGKNVSFIMPILVALSCYGAANGTVFACGRLSLAAGREGHLPDVLAMIHKDRHTPIPAVLLTSFIALVMLIPDSSQLETLISYFNFSCWTMYGLSLFAVVVLRFKKPDLHRPYKVWLITPIVMTLISIFLVVIPFFTNPWHPLAATCLILLGVPVYFIFVYLEPKHPKYLIQLRKCISRGIKKFFNLAPCTNEVM